MRPHRHAWVTCTHPDETGKPRPCGMLVCVYCNRKKPALVVGPW